MRPLTGTVRHLLRPLYGSRRLYGSGKVNTQHLHAAPTEHPLSIPNILLDAFDLPTVCVESDGHGQAVPKH